MGKPNIIATGKRLWRLFQFNMHERILLSISYQFPDDFTWGVATSAYQIEGHPLADGAGPSIWHEFAQRPGVVRHADTGDVACDHYHRYAEDIELMRYLGVKAYRFSLSWSRIFPEGRGRINAKGLDFYNRLVDGLLDVGIEPYPTLYHWDLPLALQAQGGWVNRDCAAWFADYAQAVFQCFDQKITHWTTLNEPWVVADAGYVQGIHAPGHRSLKEAPWVSHNLLRAHAMAVQAFRAESKGEIGIVVNLEPKYAASSSVEDWSAMERTHAYMNRQYLDPIFLGAYPKELADIFEDAWPRFDPEDMKLLLEPIDFLGINYYTRSVNRFDPENLPVCATPVRQEGAEYSEMDWEVYPEGLKSALLWVKRRYGNIPLYITENGAAFADPPVLDGKIHDSRRIAYFKNHLIAARQAMEQGVDLRGFFAWSLLDNFEWAEGFSKRFGLIQVDRKTQDRRLKESAHFYADLIKSGGQGLQT